MKCANIPSFGFLSQFLYISLFTARVLSEALIGGDGVKGLYVTQVLACQEKPINPKENK